MKCWKTILKKIHFHNWIQLPKHTLTFGYCNYTNEYYCSRCGLIKVKNVNRFSSKIEILSKENSINYIEGKLKFRRRIISLVSNKTVKGFSILRTLEENYESDQVYENILNKLNG